MRQAFVAYKGMPNADVTRARACRCVWGKVGGFKSKAQTSRARGSIPRCRCICTRPARCWVCGDCGPRCAPTEPPFHGRSPPGTMHAPCGSSGPVVSGQGTRWRQFGRLDIRNPSLPRHPLGCSIKREREIEEEGGEGGGGVVEWEARPASYLL